MGDDATNRVRLCLKIQPDKNKFILSSLNFLTKFDVIIRSIAHQYNFTT